MSSPWAPLPKPLVGQRISPIKYYFRLDGYFCNRCMYEPPFVQRTCRSFHTVAFRLDSEYDLRAGQTDQRMDPACVLKPNFRVFKSGSSLCTSHGTTEPNSLSHPAGKGPGVLRRAHSVADVSV